MARYAGEFTWQKLPFLPVCRSSPGRKPGEKRCSSCSSDSTSAFTTITCKHCHVVIAIYQHRSDNVFTQMLLYSSLFMSFGPRVSPKTPRLKLKEGRDHSNFKNFKQPSGRAGGSTEGCLMKQQRAAVNSKNTMFVSVPLFLGQKPGEQRCSSCSSDGTSAFTPSTCKHCQVWLPGVVV